MTMEETEVDYSYLVDPELAPDAGVSGVGLTFNKVNMGGTEVKTDASTGTELDPKKYNCPVFPGFNYDHIFVIPLLLLPKRRVLYGSPYDGTQRPPDCFSSNGVTPDMPGNILGIDVNSCVTCPFAKFGVNPGCKPRPEMYALAMFYVGGELCYYPVFLDVATTSNSNFQGLMTGLARATTIEINGEKVTKVLPPTARVIKCGRQSAKKGTYTVMTWTFQILSADSKEVDPQEGLPIPNFTPPEILQQWKDYRDAAQLQLTSLSQPVALLEGGKDGDPVYAGVAAGEGGSVDAAAPDISADDFS